MHVTNIAPRRRTFEGDQVRKRALMVYICLSTIHFFSDVWNKVSGKMEMGDYRHSGIYLFLAPDMRAPRSGILAYPHRLFFGQGVPVQQRNG